MTPAEPGAVAETIRTAWCESTQPPEQNTNYKEGKDMPHMSFTNVISDIVLFPTVSTAPAPKPVSYVFSVLFFLTKSSDMRTKYI